MLRPILPNIDDAEDANGGLPIRGLYRREYSIRDLETLSSVGPNRSTTSHC